MALVALIVGAILIAAAVRNTQGVLFGALAADLPPFMLWAAALFAVGAIGFVPGLKPVARGLLALVLLVIIMNNYQAILSGLSHPLGTAASPPSAPGSTAQAGGAPSGLGDLAHLGEALGSLGQFNPMAQFGGGL